MEQSKEKTAQKYKMEIDTLKKENDSLNIRIGGIESEIKVRRGRRYWNER